MGCECGFFFPRELRKTRSLFVLKLYNIATLKLYNITTGLITVTAVCATYCCALGNSLGGEVLLFLGVAGIAFH